MKNQPSQTSKKAQKNRGHQECNPEEKVDPLAEAREPFSPPQVRPPWGSGEIVKGPNWLSLPGKSVTQKDENDVACQEASVTCHTSDFLDESEFLSLGTLEGLSSGKGFWPVPSPHPLPTPPVVGFWGLYCHWGFWGAPAPAQSFNNPTHRPDHCCPTQHCHQAPLITDLTTLCPVVNRVSCTQLCYVRQKSWFSMEKKNFTVAFDLRW